MDTSTKNENEEQSNNINMTVEEPDEVEIEDNKSGLETDDENEIEDNESGLETEEEIGLETDEDDDDDDDSEFKIDDSFDMSSLNLNSDNTDTIAREKTSASKKKKYGLGIYTLSVLTRKVVLSFQEIGSNLQQLLHTKLEQTLEGKCSEEGFIKPNSIRIMRYSSGNVESNNVTFTVLFECLLCYPIEGMKLKVIATEITMAGIHAETVEDPSPIDVFVARDHHFDKRQFAHVKSGNQITVRVIGQRFELNDERISVLAELLNVEKIHKKDKK